jgi:hypothetical protein
MCKHMYTVHTCTLYIHVHVNTMHASFPITHVLIRTCTWRGQGQTIIYSIPTSPYMGMRQYLIALYCVTIGFQVCVTTSAAIIIPIYHYLHVAVSTCITTYITVCTLYSLHFSTCMYTTLYVVHASLLFLWLFNYSRDHVESTHLLHSYVDMYVCNYLLLTVIVT